MSSQAPGQSHLYQSIERIGNLMRSEIRKAAMDFGLQPVHLQVLNYLSQCNQYSDTTAAVTDYLGATKGTVSQSLQLLERRGYIDKEQDGSDRRVYHLRLSKEGDAVLKELLPPSFYHLAEGKIAAGECQATADVLIRLLTELQRANGLKTFGVCQSCELFRSDGNSHQCGLTLAPLGDDAIVKICREHTPPEELVKDDVTD